MIIRPLRLNASRRNRRQTNHQWRSKRSEMQFRRHLAIRYGGWRDRYVRMPLDMRLWKMSMMGVAHIAQSVKLPANTQQSQQSTCLLYTYRCV